MTEVRHFLDVDDLEPDELADLLAQAAIRRDHPDRVNPTPLTRRTLAMLFEKPSTRTRVSFETGMTRLGGHAIFLGPDVTQLDRGEPLKDTARALSGYVDAIMARVFAHDHLEELAAYASVPVINALSDVAHPCQTLADLLTIDDVVGFDADPQIAWVGDGNNVARSFAVGCAMLGLDLTIATPPGYEVGDDILDRTAAFDGRPCTTTDPRTAVSEADVVYTDVWVSMGQEDDRAAKLSSFEEFQLDTELLAMAADDVAVLHCLPAHRGEEITDDVIESEHAVVWRQAENRMHAQNALLIDLID